MRISGGSAKGRKVGLRKAFVAKGEGDELRPTSSKARQAIFDILGDRVMDADFLDLYAGTGAVGLEALSRGAKRVVFVERNNKRADMIKKFIDDFGFKDRALVVKDRVDTFLTKMRHRFDVVFIDPPYESKELADILPLIDKANILNNDGSVIIEHSSKKKMPDAAKNIIMMKSYKYGDTALTLYRKESI